MCGIAGKLNFTQQKIDPSQIKTMTDKLSHRGPDSSGFFVSGQIGLGHRRLSIIDLSKNGSQPMTSADGRFSIVFNGEIYNFPVLRQELEKDGVRFFSRSDTEVLLYLFAKYGAGCLSRLNGMFAFAIWDKEKKELFLARDRVGKKPIKYYLDKKFIAFASELKALLVLPEIKRQIDWPAIDEFLTYKYIHAPRTGFKNIHKLLPGHFMTINENGKVKTAKYWDLNFSSKLKLPEKKWEKNINDLLIKAVGTRLKSDVELGVHLSGGIDSSVIVGIIAKDLGQKVNTFSVGFVESEHNELPYARQVAKQYRANHHKIVIKPNALDILEKLAYQYEEPYADASAIPTWYLSKATKKYFTVALNGDGGDENFAGYERYHAIRIYNLIKYLPGKSGLRGLSQMISAQTNKKIWHKLYRIFNAYQPNPYDFFLNLISYLSQEDKKLIYSGSLSTLTSGLHWREAELGYYQKTHNASPLDRLLALGIKTHLPDDLLAKVDIASMAHGLEVRSPLLDHRLLELTASMPDKLKLRGTTKKYIFKKIAAKYIPDKCINRPKHGFTVPLDSWFRRELKGYIADNLLDPKFIGYGFRSDGLKNLINRHNSGKEDLQNQLYSLLMLRLWLKQWFE